MKTFNPSELYMILEFISNTLDTKVRIKKSDVFIAMNDLMSPPRKEVEFLSLLSDNIKSGRLGGLKIVKGKMGGIVVADFDAIKSSLEILSLERQVEKPATTVAVVADFDGIKTKAKTLSREAGQDAPGFNQQSVRPESKAKKPYLSSQAVKKTSGSYRWLWIRDSRYAVPMSTEPIKTFLLRVMRAKEDHNGSIVFDGKKYSGDEQLLSRFLLDFVGAGMPNTSEPLLDTVDANGVPVNMIPDVHNDPSPETLANWNQTVTEDNAINS
jgi:hypothetical protein